MTTRLVLCFDGTWNRPDPVTGFETNVTRFYESVPAGNVAGGNIQNKWYEPGVGTDWYDRVAGGAFGLGIDQKIQEDTAGYPTITPAQIRATSRCMSWDSAGVLIRPAASSA